MSVLNKTLKGLQGREHQHPNLLPDEQMVNVTSIKSGLSEKAHRRVLLLLVVITLSLVAFIIYKKNMVQSFVKETQPVTANNVTNPSPQPSNQLTTEPNASDSQVSKVPKDITTSTSVSDGNSVEKTLSESQSNEQRVQLNNSAIQAASTPAQSDTQQVANKVASKQSKPVTVSSEPLIKVDKAESTVDKLDNNLVKKIAKLSASQLAQNHFEAGKKAFNFGMVGDAISALQDCISVLDTHLECRSLLAAAFYGRKEVDKSISVLEQGLRIHPESIEWRTLLAKIYAETKQYASVLSVLGQPYEAKAKNDFWILKGVAAQKLSQHEVALRSFKKLTMLEPGQGKWWLAMGSSAEALQRWNSASQYYTTATQIGGLSPASQKHAIARLKYIRGRVNAS